MGSAWILLTLLGCLALTASVSSKKMKCYYCQFQYSALKSKAPTSKYCVDPFDKDDDIKKIECEGTCYKQQGVGKDEHQGVVRGCWEKDNKSGKCTPVSDTAGDFKYTRHCCKSNKCNSAAGLTAGVALISIALLFHLR